MKAEVHIQHILKECRSLENNSARFTQSKILKMYQKNQNSFTKSTIQNVSLQKKEMRPDTTEPNYQPHHQKVGDEYQACQQ
jgi:hypothetical protein